MALNLYEQHRPREVTVTVSVGADFSGDFPASGAADDVDINAALVLVNGLGGGEVRLLQGTFVLVDPIVFPGNNLVLSGLGRATFIDGDGLGDNENAIEISGRTDCAVRDLAIQTNDGGGLTIHCIFVEDGSDRFQVVNVWIVDSDDDGIHIEGTNIESGWILNCKILDTDGNGILVDMDGDNLLLHLQVKDNLIQSSGGAAISLDLAHFSEIQGNEIEDAITDGIYLNESDYSIVQNNIIDNPGNDGIEFDDSDYCSAEGNTIYSAGNHGIAHAAGVGSVTITVGGNTIIDTTEKAITLANISYMVIVGNNIRTAKVGIDASFSDAFVASNRIHTVTNEGIYLQGARSFAVANHCENCATGLRLGADYCQAHENFLYDNTTGLLMGAGHDNNDLRDNHYNGNTTHVSDGGSGNIFNTIPLYIVTYNTAAETEDGPTIAVGGEWASFVGQLPPGVVQVLKIEIWGVTNQTDADQMLLEIEVEGGADNEPKTTHDTGVLANQQSVTSNFAAEDIIHWSINPAEVIALLGGDSVKCVVRHEAVTAPDIATDADFRRVLVHVV